VVKLRRDDRPLLNGFRRDFEMGSVRDVETPEPWSPAVVWHVTGARDVLKGIALFESAHLLGRKARQFRAWRPGAEAIARAIIAKEPVDRQVVETARRELAQATAYRPPSAPLHRNDGNQPRAAPTAYEATRRRSNPYWPKRETIAAAFGSWYEALVAAGLGDRAARRTSAA
jgi:hypothetical protein